MSREEVKTAITQLLENTPEEVLKEVYDYLNAVQGKSTQSVNLSQNLRTILSEDKELLEKLAKWFQREVLEIHEILIDHFGGSKGVRDTEQISF